MAGAAVVAKALGGHARTWDAGREPSHLARPQCSNAETTLFAFDAAPLAIEKNAGFPCTGDKRLFPATAYATTMCAKLERKGVAMFAPPIKAAKAKVGHSTASLTPHRLGVGAADRARRLQRTIGNQATLRLLAGAPLAAQRQNDPRPAPASDQAPAPPAPHPAAPQAAAPANKPLLYGMLSQSISGPLTFSNFVIKEEPGIRIRSPTMYATGTVIADTSVPVAEYEIGFVQNLTSSSVDFTYSDSAGRTVQTLNYSVTPVPIRDSEVKDKPWSVPGDVKALSAKDGYIVNTNDRPDNWVPWRTPDGKGRLTGSKGAEVFLTWLAARHKPSGAMYFLGWGYWAVDWGCSFDPVKETGKSTGAGGKAVTSGDGQGLITPLTSGAIANESVKTSSR